MHFKLSLLLGLFCSLLIGMNVLSVKMVTILGISTSVGFFMVPFTFLITDIVTEVYGKKVTHQFIVIGVISIITVLLYSLLFVWLQPSEQYQFNEEYTTIFGQSARVFLASIIAFLVSQFNDAWIYNKIKQLTNGKHLWLRNNLSTMLSQAIDTLLFMTIAFYNTTPTYTFMFILQIAIPYYLLKVAFASLNTPLVYLGVNWLKNNKEDSPS